MKRNRMYIMEKNNIICLKNLKYIKNLYIIRKHRKYKEGNKDEFTILYT